MTASNHFIVGAGIGALVANPLIAAPLAIASHFLLDALPHFGFNHDGVMKRGKSRLFKSVIIGDTIIASCFILALSFVFERPELIVFSLLALSPDMEWIYRFGYKERFGKVPGSPLGITGKLHAKIQTMEFPAGIFIEMILFSGLLLVFINEVS